MIAVLAAAIVVSAQAAVPQHGKDAPPVALVETFADGTAAFEIATAKPAWRYTPNFPRVPGFVPPPGQAPVANLKFSRVLTDAGIKVLVSVMAKGAGDEQPVSEVLVTPGSRVVVNELRAFGVAPVTLSMVTVGRFTPYPPIVSSIAPEIEIARVDVRNDPYPGYVIALRNLSATPVSNVHFQAYRAEVKALSGLPRGEQGAPLIGPGATHELTINLTSGSASTTAPPSSWAPLPLDVIEIDSVRWADGSSTGTSPYPQIEPKIEQDGGLRVQMPRVMQAFRSTLAETRSGADLLASLKQQIDALPQPDPNQLPAAQDAMRGFKAAVLGDITRFERSAASHGEKDVRVWLEAALKRYEIWFRRLAA